MNKYLIFVFLSIGVFAKEKDAYKSLQGKVKRNIRTVALFYPKKSPLLNKLMETCKLLKIKFVAIKNGTLSKDLLSKINVQKKELTVRLFLRDMQFFYDFDFNPRDPEEFTQKLFQQFLKDNTFFQKKKLSVEDLQPRMLKYLADQSMYNVYYGNTSTQCYEAFKIMSFYLKNQEFIIIDSKEAWDKLGIDGDKEGFYSINNRLK